METWKLEGRQPVPHDGAEEHPGVHDGLADGAAALHHAGGRAVSVQSEADLHHGGAAGEAVPAESRVGVGRGVRVRSDAVAIGGDAEQSLSADAAFRIEMNGVELQRAWTRNRKKEKSKRKSSSECQAKAKVEKTQPIHSIYSFTHSLTHSSSRMRRISSSLADSASSLSTS